MESFDSSDVAATLAVTTYFFAASDARVYASRNWAYACRRASRSYCWWALERASAALTSVPTATAAAPMPAAYKVAVTMSMQQQCHRICRR